MNYKTIKVSDKNYQFLLREASLLQQYSGKKATFDDAITALSKAKGLDIDSYAGTLSEEDAKVMLDSIRRMREQDK